MTSVPVFDRCWDVWRWFATDSLRVKDDRVTGILHREDGPAIEWAGGTRMWLISGKYHREDGPAIENALHGTQEWWIYGTQFGDEEAWRRARDAKQRTR